MTQAIPTDPAVIEEHLTVFGKAVDQWPIVVGVLIVLALTWGSIWLAHRVFRPPSVEDQVGMLERLQKLAERMRGDS